MSGVCECGALAPDTPPELFRQTAALVSAYLFGDERTFSTLLAETSVEIIPVLVGALFASLHLIAEEQSTSPFDVLQVFCRSAESMAAEAEAAG